MLSRSCSILRKDSEKEIVIYMMYRENSKNGDQLSQLGFGCMRLPRKGTSIDIPRSTEMIHSAIEKGVNYFDTAYIYPGSEVALGQILSGEWRKKVFIATKLPVIITRTAEDIDKYFNKQLERLNTDYIDYYLTHMLTSLADFQKIQGFGIENWIAKQKSSGKIRNIGFSFHGTKEEFKKIVDAYDWDFCMIQLNYLDENHQAGMEGLQYAHAKGMPVMIMEPLRGGKLANGLPQKAVKEFKKENASRSAVDWGLRWVWNRPEVTLLLSGMGTQEQVDENIRLASEIKHSSLTEQELAAYKKVYTYMRENLKVNCTSCGYCIPCPFGVNIPNVFSNYNEYFMEKRTETLMHYMVSSGVAPQKPSYASLCKRCGKCEPHCPQNIKIMDTLRDASSVLEPFWLKPAARLAKKFTKAK